MDDGLENKFPSIFFSLLFVFVAKQIKIENIYLRLALLFCCFYSDDTQCVKSVLRMARMEHYSHMPFSIVVGIIMAKLGTITLPLV